MVVEGGVGGGGVVGLNIFAAEEWGGARTPNKKEKFATIIFYFL